MSKELMVSYEYGQNNTGYYLTMRFKFKNKSYKASLQYENDKYIVSNINHWNDIWDLKDAGIFKSKTYKPYAHTDFYIPVSEIPAKLRYSANRVSGVKKKKKEKRTFDYIVREEFNVQNPDDRRKKVNMVIVSYSDSKGYEYRKSFYFPVKTTYNKMVSQIPKEYEVSVVSGINLSKKYKQEFKNGEYLIFTPEKILKNGNFRGKLEEFYFNKSGKRKASKPKSTTVFKIDLDRLWKKI